MYTFQGALRCVSKVPEIFMGGEYMAVWASLKAQLVKNPPAMQEAQFDSWVGKIQWSRDRPPTPVIWPGGFHGLHSPWARKETDTTDWLSLSHGCLYCFSLIVYLSHVYVTIKMLSLCICLYHICMEIHESWKEMPDCSQQLSVMLGWGRGGFTLYTNIAWLSAWFYSKCV